MRERGEHCLVKVMQEWEKNPCQCLTARLSGSRWSASRRGKLRDHDAIGRFKAPEVTNTIAWLTKLCQARLSDVERGAAARDHEWWYTSLY